MTSEPWTVLRLLNWTKDHFAKAGLDAPRLCAEILLAHALKCERIMLYARFEYQPKPEELAIFRENVKRAAAQEPAAYLVGEKEFYSLRVKVTPDVLIPRAETELLVSEAVHHLRRLGRPGLAWDAFTGSGCVPVALAVQVKDATVLATDASPAAVAVAAENAKRHKVDSRLRTRVADQLALPADCADLKDFDVLTANPPYVAQGAPLGKTVQYEPAQALYAGKDGMEFIRTLVAAAPHHLRPGGALILEFGYGQADLVRDGIVAGGAFAEPRILRDHQNIERAAVAMRK